MNINCPYGLGDTLTVFPKLITLIEEENVDNLSFYLNGYYPHLLYRLLVNFDFQVPTRYIMGKPTFTDIEVHPFKIDKLDIRDSNISEKYWYSPDISTRNIKHDVDMMYRMLNKNNTIGAAACHRKENSKILDMVIRLKSYIERQEEDVILDKFARDYKNPYDVIFQPFTSLRSIRGSKPEYVEEAIKQIIVGLKGYNIALVGTYPDYIQVREIIDKYTFPHVSFLMGVWDVSEVIQAIFQSQIVVGCDSWVAYLGAMLGKRSGMYMIGQKILPEFANRIHSDNFYGFDNISIVENSQFAVSWDRFIQFLRS